MRPVPEQREAGDRRHARHAEAIRAWLAPGAEDDRGLRLSKIHEPLERQGVRMPYSSRHRCATVHCEFRDERRISARVADLTAGKVAEGDFRGPRGAGAGRAVAGLAPPDS